uniref:Uncharacterized protein n=1 Tax=Arundo donax TaxID=35708 RepID=A0A0A9H0G1_ARUDO
MPFNQSLYFYYPKHTCSPKVLIIHLNCLAYEPTRTFPNSTCVPFSFSSY